MSHTHDTPKTDLYQEVTNQIIKALEMGTPPWVCPWARDAHSAHPANLATGRRYRGINTLLLNMQAAMNGYTSNRWITFGQARALKARIKAGARGTHVVFFKMLEVEGDVPWQDTDRKVIPLLRAFTVFNAAQVDGLPERLVPAASPALPQSQEWDAIDAAEQLLIASGARIEHGGDRAYYRPADDTLRLPDQVRFADAAAYYGTALHELTHWTGAKSRCNRQLTGRQHIEAYAFEELVAEMGAAFLCSHCGIPGHLEHASYIEHWLQALRNDKRLIFAAASLAQKAADYLLPADTGEPAAFQSSEVGPEPAAGDPAANDSVALAAA